MAIINNYNDDLQVLSRMNRKKKSIKKGNCLYLFADDINMTTTMLSSIRQVE